MVLVTARRLVGKLCTATEPPWDAPQQERNGSMSFNVGDEVSYKGQQASKVTVAEVGTGYSRGSVRVQNSFHPGAQGAWVHATKLVPYGANTGREATGPSRVIRNPQPVRRAY